jgi:hypothetical protein
VVRSRLTHALDWLALALVLATAYTAFSGGWSFRLAGIRITASSPYRAAFGAVVVIALRFLFDRQTPAFAQPREVLGRIVAYLYEPSADPPPDGADRLPPATKWRRRAVAAAAYTILTVVLLFPQLRAMDSVPDRGDPLFSMWRTGWVYHKLHGDPRPLFSPNIFHPYQQTLTYSDSMLLPSLTTVPLLAAGLHPVVAYNVMMICSFVLSALAAYVLMERLTASPAAAFVSGLLFGFYPFRFEHYSHFELQMTYCMPLALLALHRLVSTGSLRHGVAFGLLAAAQLYCSMYFAVFFMWFAGAVLVLLCLLTRPPIRRLLRPLAIAGVLAAVLAVPLFRAYTAAHLGDRDVEAVRSYSATAADYLRAHHRSAMWGDRTLAGRQPERALFPGVMALALAALALVPPLGVTRVVYVGVLALMFEISRGYNGLVYPVLYEWLPFMRGLRVPARASVLVGLTLAILAGLAVRRLAAGRGRGGSAAVLAALTVAVAVDVHPRLLPLERVWPEPPPIYGWISDPARVVLAEFPMRRSPALYLADMPQMYFSLWHWAQLINGYSGHSPADFDDFQGELRPFPNPPTIDLLRARGATHVSVNCALYRDGCDRLIETLDAHPSFHVIASGKWQGRPVRMYELR